MLNQRRHTTDLRGHHRAPRRHGFDQRASHSFIQGGQDEDIHTSQAVRHVIARAGEGERMPDTQTPRGGVELLLQLAASHDQQMKPRIRRDQPRNRFHEKTVSFDRREPSDRTHDNGIGRYLQTLRSTACHTHHGPEPLHVNAAGDHREATPRSHSASKMFVPFRFRQRNQPGRHPSQQPLDQQEPMRRERAEVSIKHMAVRRVHDRRDARQPRRQPTQGTCLGRMGMDERGTLPPKQTHERPERQQVFDRIDFPSQGVDQTAWHARCLQTLSIQFRCDSSSLRIPAAGRAGDDDGLEPLVLVP